MTMKQLSIFVENTPGSLYAMTNVLAEHGVDMRALSVAESSDFGIVRIIVDNVYQATTVLKDAGYIHSLTPVVCVAIPDEPGGLSKVLKVFSEGGASVEYMYAFPGGKNSDHAYMIFRMADADAASALLAAKGVRTVGQDELAHL